MPYRIMEDQVLGSAVKHSVGSRTNGGSGEILSRTDVPLTSAQQNNTLPGSGKSEDMPKAASSPGIKKEKAVDPINGTYSIRRGMTPSFCVRTIQTTLTIGALVLILSLMLQSGILSPPLISRHPLLPEDPTMGANTRDSWDESSEYVVFESRLERFIRTLRERGDGDTSSLLNEFAKRGRAAWAAIMGASISQLEGAADRERVKIEAGKRSEKARRKTGTELGKDLLRSGDPAGAEAICALVTQRDPDAVEAWVCLGDARLLLYKVATKSWGIGDASVGGEIGGHPMAMKRLTLAKDSFEKATAADPTHPGARAGLGLSLFLLGTRGQIMEQHEKKIPQIGQSTQSFSNQLLFDAALHLNAAVVLTSNDANYVTDGGAHMQRERRRQHLTARYNLALTYLTLGDARSAVPLLRRVVDSITPDLSQSRGSISEINLAGALIQCGLAEDAIAILQKFATPICGEGESGKDLKKSTLKREQQYLGAPRNRVCSIVQNNLGVAQEMVHAQSSEILPIENRTETRSTHTEAVLENYYMANQWNDFLSTIPLDFVSFNRNALSKASLTSEPKVLPVAEGVNNTSASAGETEYSIKGGLDISESASDESLSTVVNETDTEEAIYYATTKSESSQIVSENVSIAEEISTGTENTGLISDSSNAEMDAHDVDSSYGRNEKEQIFRNSVDSSSKLKQLNVRPELKIALESLEKATANDPSQARLWLGLSRARLRAGDKAGAVEAAANAVNVAVGRDEIEAATAALEYALDRVTNVSQEPPIGPFLPSRHVRDPYSSFDLNAFGDSQTAADVNALRLQNMELKLQLLQQSVMVGGHKQGSYGMPHSPGGDNVMKPEDHGISSPRQQADKVSAGSVFGEDDKPSNKIIDQPGLAAVDEMAALGVEKTNNESAPLNQRSNETEAIENILSDEKGDSVEDVLEIATQAPAHVQANATLQDEGFQNVSNISEAEIKSGQDLNSTSWKTILLELPELFNPPRIQPKELSAVAKSYMKMADAYMDKKNFKLASKQFYKVLKKSPDHLPAIIGYATALERSGRTKQMSQVALAYGNATRAAVAQGDGGPPLSKRGEGGMAEAILRRAVHVARTSEQGKVDVLRSLSRYAHTAVLAADIHFYIGLEIMTQGENETGRKEAVHEFTIANAFAAKAKGNETSFHGKSMLELGKIAMRIEGNPQKAFRYFELALTVDLEDSKVEALMLSGQAKMDLGVGEGAVYDYKRALELPVTPATAEVHHSLALALLSQNAPKNEIEQHFVQALDMGMNPTPEAVDFLGEHHISVMRSANRAQWLEFSKARGSRSSGGGIMSGGGVSSSETAFAPQKTVSASEVSESSDMLSVIEQGAASYDGKVPEGGDNDSSLSAVGRKSRG